ncbi:MAG TPA: low molecular weight protein-tyrosine-phosphatase [Solirubrobacteraceae bacterium]|nr:low molecular weight protein-tyrosine-phosphatase [Solirubrobacteraceae bacterium]
MSRPGGEGQPVQILFVCLGNICRSPTAEGVMRSLIVAEGLEDEIELDSAGTGAWHVGSEPDARATGAAANRGVTLTGTARQVRPADFEEFDLILAMDTSNMRDLEALAPNEAARAKVCLLRGFDPASVDSDDLDVPDPYYGGDDGFGTVFDLVLAACEGLLVEIRTGRAGAGGPG